jgi:hypothetical protein
MNSTLSLSTLATMTISDINDVNGSLADDWENYKAYTKFYYITDEVFLYANPILIIIGRYFISNKISFVFVNYVV